MADDATLDPVPDGAIRWTHANGDTCSGTYVQLVGRDGGFALLRLSSSICLVSSTACLVGSSTASMRRSTHIGRMTSGYLPRRNRSRRTSSAMPQMNETMRL